VRSSVSLYGTFQLSERCRTPSEGSTRCVPQRCSAIPAMLRRPQPRRHVCFFCLSRLPAPILASQLADLLDDLLEEARENEPAVEEEQSVIRPAAAEGVDGDGAASPAASDAPPNGGGMKVKILHCDNCKIAYEVCLPPEPEPDATIGSRGDAQPAQAAGAQPTVAQQEQQVQQQHAVGTSISDG
jgi:hypothetical protein